MPEPNFWFEIGLWATEHPASAMIAMSASVTHTEWAIVVRSLRAPMSCMYSIRVFP